MKIGVISDVHGNSDALQAVLRELAGAVEQVLFLGDLCGYYPFVNECAEMLRAVNVIGVLGNHDQVLLDCLTHRRLPPAHYTSKYGSALSRSIETLSKETQDLMRTWPAQRHMDYGGKTALLCHGAPWDPIEGRVYPDFDQWQRFDGVAADLVLLGQTHYPMVHALQRALVVNPGSVGQPRHRSGRASFAVLDIPSCSVELRETAFDPAILIRDAQAHDPQMPYLVEVLTR